MTIIVYFNDKRDLNEARDPYFHVHSIQLSSTQLCSIQHVLTINDSKLLLLLLFTDLQIP